MVASANCGYDRGHNHRHYCRHSQVGDQMLAGVVLLLALSSHKAPKTDVASVYCTPVIGFRGTPFQLRLVVENPRKFTCPQVTIFWPDETKSIRESDCPPETQSIGVTVDGDAPATAQEYPDFRPPSVWRLRGSGTITMRVLLKQGRNEKALTCNVLGIGDE